MPNLLAYRIGPNPSPVMQSFDPRLNLRNFAIPIVPPENSRKVVFALLTMWTTKTALGTQAALKQIRPSPISGRPSIWLRSDVANSEAYPFECEDYLHHRNDDYIQLGWDQVCLEFNIIDRADGNLLLEATKDEMCFGKKP